MTEEIFCKLLQEEALGFTKHVQTEDKQWIIKGFIDVYKSIYTISIDTKVVSKVIEILLHPKLIAFAKRNDMIVEPAKHQNFYPDYTFIHTPTGNKFAVDIKTTIRDGKGKIKAMTLGTFQGYFRQRDGGRSINYPYNQYSGHFCLGAIYSQYDDATESGRVFTLDEIENITSVVGDFEFFAQPKYKISSGTPGSGNTKNIGSITDLDALRKGAGPFSMLGKEVFDDYWMFFQNQDMAGKGNKRPYSNLIEYTEYKKKNSESILEHESELRSMPKELLGENTEEETE